MSNNKQSSIEWYAEQFAEHIEENYGIKITSLTLLNKAKAMHKKEIMDAVGVGSQFDRDYLYGYHDKAEQYYKETFE